MVRRSSTIEDMIEAILPTLVRGDHGEISRLVPKVARSWPNEPALWVSLALSSASSGLEHAIDDFNIRNAAADGYRLAAIVAADVAALEALGMHPVKAQHLLPVWSRVLPLFLQKGGGPNEAID